MIPQRLKPKNYRPVFLLSRLLLHIESLLKAAAYRPLAYTQNRHSPKPLCAFLCRKIGAVLRTKKQSQQFCMKYRRSSDFYSLLGDGYITTGIRLAVWIGWNPHYTVPQATFLWSRFTFHTSISNLYRWRCLFIIDNQIGR